MVGSTLLRHDREIPAERSLLWSRRSPRRNGARAVRIRCSRWWRTEKRAARQQRAKEEEFAGAPTLGGHDPRLEPPSGEFVEQFLAAVVATKLQGGPTRQRPAPTERPGDVGIQILGIQPGKAVVVRDPEEEETARTEHSRQFIECVVVRNNVLQGSGDGHGVEDIAREWERRQRAAVRRDEVVAEDIDRLAGAGAERNDAQPRRYSATAPNRATAVPTRRRRGSAA